MAASREILELYNHARVRRVLEAVGAGASIEHLDKAVAEQTRTWLRLGEQHIRSARSLRRACPREWRSVVSRAYYGAYNASKAVRYFVDGSVKLDASDHKDVGELPKDFPERARWSEFVVALREARNKADYDPWADTFRELRMPARDLLREAARFFRSARDYLRRRGVTP